MTIELDVKVPSLNEYISKCRRNQYEAAKFKREKQSEIAVYLARMPRFDKPLRIDFTWIEENRKRDLDNVCGCGLNHSAQQREHKDQRDAAACLNHVQKQPPDSILRRADRHPVSASRLR